METFKNMIGRTMQEIKGSVGDDVMLFRASDGSEFRFYHEQDCCESVSIEDIAGDLSDLIGSPILMAESVDSLDPEGFEANGESYTWTFYKFRTQKGDVTVRWFGSSNGYYGEGVYFSETIAV